MAPDDLYYEIHSVLQAVGRRLNVPVDDAELLHLHSNAIYLMPSADLVVRIATNPDAFGRIAGAVRVTRWLAKRGFPCVVPAEIGEQPFLIDGRVVSIWQHVSTVAAPRPTGADLGDILRLLHSEPVPPEPPERLADPLASVARAIDQWPEVLPREHHQWLNRQISPLGDTWQNVAFPHQPGLIHGDAHPGNLMVTTTGGTVMGDWDHVALGPREWDLAQIHYTHRRFGTPSAEDLDTFADTYGWDIRDWPGLYAMIQIREISGLSAYIRTATTKPFSRQELLRRLETLQRGETSARWNRPT